MAEDKPHEATAGKIRKARSEGNIAKSGELNTIFAFAATALTTLALIPNFVPVLTNWLRDAAYGKPISWVPIVHVAVLSLIPMVVTGLVATILTLIQVQGIIIRPIKFDLKKLNQK